MKNENIISLIEAISDKSLLNKDDLYNLISCYFNMWQDSNSDKNNFDTIVQKRNNILAKQTIIATEKDAIERKVLAAKSKLKKGFNIDTEWLASANLALRIKRRQYVKCQNDLSNLKSIEKKIIAKEFQNKDKKMLDSVFNELSNDKSKEFAIAIYNKAKLNLNINKKVLS